MGSVSTTALSRFLEFFTFPPLCRMHSRHFLLHLLNTEQAISPFENTGESIRVDGGVQCAWPVRDSRGPIPNPSFTRRRKLGTAMLSAEAKDDPGRAPACNLRPSPTTSAY
jgi:hypothetical protein